MLITVEQKLKALKSPALGEKRFEFDLIQVKKSVARTPVLAKWVDDYNQSLKAMNLKNAGSVIPPKEGQAGYVGDAECASCHVDAKAFWDNTKHARACLRYLRQCGAHNMDELDAQARMYTASDSQPGCSSSHLAMHTAIQ